MTTALSILSNDLAEFGKTRAKWLQIGLGIDTGLLKMVEQLLHTAELRESGDSHDCVRGEEEETEQREDVVKRGVDTVLWEDRRVVGAIGIAWSRWSW